jgi:hypothetical protein
MLNAAGGKRCHTSYRHSRDTDPEHWTVEITEIFEVKAPDIDSALRVSRQLRPGARITALRIKP